MEAAAVPFLAMHATGVNLMAGRLRVIPQLTAVVYQAAAIKMSNPL
jgi:hypothetical protein